MRYPFDTYRIGTRYGVKGKLWSCGWHSGQDFLSAKYGGDGVVYPLYAGTVLKAATNAAYGNYVQVKHPDGYVTLYAHMRIVYVKPGMRVDEQTVLGVEGQTGKATGKHLHVEVHKGSYKYPASIDPLAFIRERGGDEVEKKIKLRLNGVEKEVQAIEKGGHNYVKLQDLRDGRIDISYDAKAGVPIVVVK
ncbi:MAG: M23 family metallopeptidase [Clostridium sp.]|nr:M23 family metallopeptidase [Clostridium sp.]